MFIVKDPLKKSKKIKKINYLQNRLKHYKKNLFYHLRCNHQRLLNKYFSKISDISHLPFNYLRTYKTPFNKLKLIIRLLPTKRLKQNVSLRI